MVPNRENTPDTPDFWLENKMFHNSFRVFIITPVFFKSASLAIITEISGLSHLLCIFCMMNVVKTREGNIILQNIQ